MFWFFVEVGQHPDFIKKLPESVEAAKGESLNLEVEVAGEPAPRVEWFKDGVAIEGLPDFNVI